MAESIHWQIAEVIRSRLEAIAGDDGTTYWYTPDRAVYTLAFENVLADTTLKQVFIVMAGEERQSEEATGSASTGGVVRSLSEFFVLMLRRDPRATTNAYREGDPTRERVVSRMVRDFVRAMWLDVTLGGLAINIARESLVIDRNMVIEGPWAVAEARFDVDYDFLALTP
jgi:hypothetical protein